LREGQKILLLEGVPAVAADQQVAMR